MAKYEKLLSRRKADKALLNIETNLAGAYPAPAGVSFSKDADVQIIEKAVLYHKIRGSAALRGGEKSAVNDIRYHEFADAVTGGNDPVVEFIRSKSTAEQAELLEELTCCDTGRAWFEDMLIRSAEKKAEADAAASGAKKGDVPQNTPERLKAESSAAQSVLLQRLAASRGETPLDFLSRSENAQAVKRMLAVELHQSQLEFELEELREAARYESPENRASIEKLRAPFAFEEQASADYEAHIKRLADSPEVAAQFQRLAQLKSMEELGDSILTPPRPEHLKQRDSLRLFEERFVPGAVNAFLDDPDSAAMGEVLRDKLEDLSAMNGLPFAEITAAECQKRLDEYKGIIDHLDDFERSMPGRTTASARKLKAALSGEMTRLEDVTLAPYREKIEFNFRADMLIDYVDPNDPQKRPMDAVEAREKLLRGAELEQLTFADGEFVGTAQKISYDKKTGMMNKGPEKLITRVVDLSDKTGRKPEAQIEELRKIKDVLTKTDVFYAKNPESFKKTLDSLNKVIKAHETLDREANVRQVAKLRELYAELDENAAQYISAKGDALKAGDERGQFRLDAIRTLQTISGGEHVKGITAKLFNEQAKLEKQQKRLRPCRKIMEKWKNAEPTDKASAAEYKKDFEALSTKISALENKNGEMPYFRMNIAEDMKGWISKADKAGALLDAPEKIDEGKLKDMKEFMGKCDAASKELYAMDGTIKPAKKEKIVEAPEKVKAPVA